MPTHDRTNRPPTTQHSGERSGRDCASWGEHLRPGGGADPQHSAMTSSSRTEVQSTPTLAYSRAIIANHEAEAFSSTDIGVIKQANGRLLYHSCDARSDSSTTPSRDSRGPGRWRLLMSPPGPHEPAGRYLVMAIIFRVILILGPSSSPLRDQGLRPRVSDRRRSP